MNVSGSSSPGIPAERDRQTIQDLHMAIERGTLLRLVNLLVSVLSLLGQL
jgi:hypothetical protein